MTTRDLGALIRAARRSAGLTGTELAIAVGRDASAVSRWERNEQRPTGEVVVRLIEILGLDPQVVHSLLTHVGTVERVPYTVTEAIRADDDLCPEAKAKLIGLYQLIRQVPMPKDKTNDDPDQEADSRVAA